MVTDNAISFKDDDYCCLCWQCSMSMVKIFLAGLLQV